MSTRTTLDSLESDLVGIVREVSKRTLKLYRASDTRETQTFTNPYAGHSVEINVTNVLESRDVQPQADSRQSQDPNPRSVTLNLNQWKEAAYQMSDRDKDRVNWEMVAKKYMESATQALFREVDTYLFNQYYPQVYNVHGWDTSNNTVSSNLFPSDNPTGAFTDAYRLIQEADGPADEMDRMFMFLSPQQYANVKGTDEFQRVQNYGNDSIIRGGVLMEAQGFMVCPTNTLTSITHTAGMPGTPAVMGAAAAGSTSLVIDGYTAGSPPVVGDLFTIAGDDTVYTVQSVQTATSSSTVTVGPALQSAAADNALITVAPNHRVNLAFHQTAFAAAAKALGQAEGGAYTDKGMYVDPETGLPYKVEAYRQEFQDKLSVSTFYGAVAVRPEWAVRLITSV